MKKVALALLIITSCYQLNFGRRVAPSEEEVNSSHQKRLEFQQALDQKIQDLKEGIADLESVNTSKTFFSAEDYQYMINLLECNCMKERKKLVEYSSRMY